MGKGEERRGRRGVFVNLYFHYTLQIRTGWLLTHFLNSDEVLKGGSRVWVYSLKDAI